MPRESQQARKQRAVQVLDRLDAHMPNAEIELRYRSPMDLLVAVILSAQCTDKRVNVVTPALFARYPDPAAYARADVAELESMIKTCGLYRGKAKNIIATAKAVVEQHGGQVPAARGELETLPGVGRKTAGVVCIHLGGEPAFPVDTHVRRLSNRLGFSTHAHPDKVELDLQKLLPVERWTRGHHLLIWHGRRTCYARSPACDRCVVADLCPKIGVRREKATAKGKPAPASRPRARP